MTTRHPLTISLTPELADFVATEVRSGQYASASEVIRAGLRLLAAGRAHPPEDRGATPDAPRRVGFRAVREDAQRG